MKCILFILICVSFSYSQKIFSEVLYERNLPLPCLGEVKEITGNCYKRIRFEITTNSNQVNLRKVTESRMYSSHSEKQKQSVTIFNGNFKNYNNYLTQLSEDTCFWHELKKQFDAKGTDVVEELVLPIFIIDHLASFLTKTTSRFCGEKKITNNSDLIAFITMQLINDIVDNNSEEDTLWLLNKLFNL